MRSAHTLLLRTICTFALCVAQVDAHADVYVIAHPSRSSEQLSRQQVADLYLGRTRSLQQGDYVTLLDRPDEQAVRERFFRLLTNMSLTQINAYWARLTFTGRQPPPQPKASDALVIQAVSRDPRTIGYISNPPPDNQVHVILHLHE